MRCQLEETVGLPKSPLDCLTRLATLACAPARVANVDSPLKTPTRQNRSDRVALLDPAGAAFAARRDAALFSLELPPSLPSGALATVQGWLAPRCARPRAARVSGGELTALVFSTQQTARKMTGGRPPVRIGAFMGACSSEESPTRGARLAAACIQSRLTRFSLAASSVDDQHGPLPRGPRTKVR